MKTVSFRQVNRVAVGVGGGTYLAALITTAIVFWNPLTEVVNGMSAGGNFGTGLLIAVVAFAPLVALLLLAKTRVELTRDGSSFTVRTRAGIRHIAISDVLGVIDGAPQLGRIRVLDSAGSTLIDVTPPERDRADVLDVLVTGLFRVVEQRPVFDGRETVTTYGR